MARINKVGSTATTVKIDGNNGSVTYHYTTVVQWSEKEIKLNSNGWLTTTTKTRMNQASNEYGLGFCVFQKNRKWFVSFKGKTIDFSDNMTLKR